MKRLLYLSLGICLSEFHYIYVSDFSFVANESSWYENEPVRSLRTVFHDLKRLGKHLFSVESGMVLAPFIPLFGIAHLLDKPIHYHFYCPAHHKNRGHCSEKLLDASETLVAISIGWLLTCSFAVRNRQLQRAAQLYAVTLPLTWGVKNLIKTWKWHDNIRPRNERYSCKDHYGGFPSGHMLEMTYATTLFGLTMGAPFGIPLAINTAIVATAFVKSNRHYVSQLIAGAAFGTVLGCAAYWTVKECEYNWPVQISCVPNGRDAPFMALRAQYYF